MHRLLSGIYEFSLNIYNRLQSNMFRKNGKNPSEKLCLIPFYSLSIRGLVWVWFMRLENDRLAGATEARSSPSLTKMGLTQNDKM